MTKYVCIRKCYFQTRLWEEGDILHWTEEIPPVRHFQLTEGEPVVIKVEVKPETNDEDDIEKVRAELDEAKVPYDRRWGITKLRHELIIAKKNRGV